jgi:glycogen debranching enzyme
MQSQHISPPSMLQALTRILSPTGFPYGSNWELFKDAHFGRDSLEVAEDLLRYRPEIARAVIMRLASLQGTAVDPASEEEPGRIHHEYRALVIDGHPIARESRRIFYQLAALWNPDSTREELQKLPELTYYGTIDATPLYVRLVGAYCSIYGTDVLRERYRPRRWDGNGPLPCIEDSVRRAVDWVARRIRSSDLGLLEFQRTSRHGARFQAWKDGHISYLHPDGTLANYKAPIASIEVQGLAYDALSAALAILTDAPRETQESWTALRDFLQRQTLDLFWMPEERFFAMAIDRDPRTGLARQMRLVSSNAGALLDSGIFDTVSTSHRQLFVSSVVDKIYNCDFLTPVGVRTSSLVHAAIPGYAAYQGSHTVWHKETYDIAKGMRRQGYPRLAADLENRLLNAVNVAGPREFLYVTADNRVDYHPSGTRSEGAEEIVGTNVPENDQAWTVSAALAIKYRRGSRMREVETTAEARELENRKLREVSPVHLYRTAPEIEEAYRTGDRFWINRSAAADNEGNYRDPWR